LPKIVGGSLASHRQHTREQLFGALSDLIRERGYDAITLADVASRSGMARTAIYNYFPDKDSLLVGFAANSIDSYTTELRDALDDIAHPIDRLRAYIRIQYRYLAAQHLPPGPALRVLLSKDAYSRVAHHIRSLDDRLHEILEDGVIERYLPSKDIATTATLVTACINTASIGSADPDSLDEAIDNAVPLPVISAALFARFASRQEQSPALKAVAALRQQFGGHAVKAADPA